MGHRQPWVDAMRRERGAAVAAPALHVFGTGRPGGEQRRARPIRALHSGGVCGLVATAPPPAANCETALLLVARCALYMHEFECGDWVVVGRAASYVDSKRALDDSKTKCGRLFRPPGRFSW